MKIVSRDDVERGSGGKDGRMFFNLTTGRLRIRESNSREDNGVYNCRIGWLIVYQ